MGLVGEYKGDRTITLVLGVTRLSRKLPSPRRRAGIPSHPEDFPTPFPELRHDRYHQLPGHRYSRTDIV